MNLIKFVACFLFLSVLCVLYVFSAGIPHAQTPSNPEDVSSAYRSLLQTIKDERQQLAKNALPSPGEQKAWPAERVQKFLVNGLENQLTPQWLGTPWDFNGTTQTPQQGAIACGYFVTTLLRDLGFQLPRIRLAQMSSEKMIKRLTTERYIKRFSNTPIADFVAAVKTWGSGLYIVGLDNHTGFIVNNGDKVLFIHSSYVVPKQVVKELASHSVILSHSKYRILGKISADEALLKQWLKGRSVGFE